MSARRHWRSDQMTPGHRVKPGGRAHTRVPRGNCLWRRDSSRPTSCTRAFLSRSRSSRSSNSLRRRSSSRAPSPDGPASSGRAPSSTVSRKRRSFSDSFHLNRLMDMLKRNVTGGRPPSSSSRASSGPCLLARPSTPVPPVAASASAALAAFPRFGLTYFLTSMLRRNVEAGRPRSSSSRASRASCCRARPSTRWSS